MVGPKVSLFGSIAMATGNASAQSLLRPGESLGLVSSHPFMLFPGAVALNSNPVPAANVEVIRIDPSAGSNVTPQNKFGFSNQVPAILASIQLQPAIDGASPTAVGQMLDFQTSARQLRAEDIIRLINELKSNDATKSTILDLERRIDDLEQETAAEIQFLGSMAKVLAEARLALRIKANDSAIKDDILRRRRIRGDVSAVKGPIDVLISDLLFSSDGVLAFSDTKIIATLIDDLLTLLSTFSPSLLDGVNQDRLDDRDASSLTRLSDSGAYSFSISSIASAPGLSKASDSLTVINKSRTLQFLRALDRVGNLDNRLKVSLFVLSKELRASTGLSLGAVQDALSKIFNLQKFEGNVFNAIIGNVGKDAFQQTFSSNTTLASVLRIPPSANGTRPMVLPFESSFIESDGPGGPADYVPGSDFYVNSIVRGKTKFDVSPLQNIAGALNAMVTGVATIVEGMLDVDVLNQQSLRMHPDDVLRAVVKSMMGTLERLAPGSQSIDVIGPALLFDAQSDPHLKHLLFVYLLVLGLMIDEDKSNVGGNKFFASMRAAGLTPDVVQTEVSSLSSTDETVVRFSDEPLNMVLSDISSVITDYVIQKYIDSTGIRYNAPEQVTYYTDQIKSYLTSSPWEDASSVFSQIISVLSTLDSNSRQAIDVDQPSFGFAPNADAYFSNTNHGMTKFSGLPGTMLLRLMLEIFSIMSAKYPISHFETTPDASKIQVGDQFGFPQGVNIVINTAEISPSSGGFNSFLFGSALSAAGFMNDASQLAKAIQVATDLNALATKLTSEDKIIRDILDVLIGVSSNVKQASNDVSAFFDKEGANAAQLSDILRSLDADEKLSILDRQQVNLAQATLLEHQTARSHALDTLSNDVASSGVVSPFIDDSVIVQGVSYALQSMLREPELLSPKADHSQIITVGLPAGFLDSLHERLSTFIVGQDLSEFNRRANVRDDVIKINVHMIDHVMGDLVFKPLSFIFQMSRFSTNMGFLNVNRPEMPFDSMVESIITTRATTPDGSSFQDELLSNPSDQSYSFLTVDQRRSMVKNHVMSYLLSMYVKLLTGVELQEDNFFVSSLVDAITVDATTRDEFIALLEAHVSNVAGQKLTIEQLRRSSQAVDDLLTRLDANRSTAGVIDPVKTALSNQSKAKNIEISSDLVTFINMFSPSSIIFGAGARRLRTVSPKKFERVFNLLVNPGDFEIDVEMTNSTMSGRTFLASKVVQDMVYRESSDRTSPIDPRQYGTQSSDQNSVLKLDISKRDRVGGVGLMTFFVTVDQLPELSPLDVKLTVPTPRFSPASTSRPISSELSGAPILLDAIQKLKSSPLAPQQSNDAGRQGSLSATLGTRIKNFL